jgi:predicted nucleic acid-binding protein
MIVVVDSSVILAVALNEPQREAILESTSESDLLAPELLPYEIGNALSAMVRRKRLTSEEALTVIRQVDRIPIRLAAVRLEAALEIAFRHRIFAYDAYFLHCAQSNNASLITLDQPMQRIAGKIGVKVLEF